MMRQVLHLGDQTRLSALQNRDLKSQMRSSTPCRTTKRSATAAVFPSMERELKANQRSGRPADGTRHSQNRSIFHQTV